MNIRHLIRRCLVLPALLGLAIVVGCGGGDDAAPPAGPAAVVIGLSGGVVNGPDGVSVTVPAGALANDTALQITAASATVLPLPAGIVANAKQYDLLPHGTVFSVPARLSLPRDPADPLDTSILKTNLAGTAWEQLVTTSVGSTHSALITSFSSSRMMCNSCGPAPPPPVISMQPVDASADEGGFVSIAVSAIGVQPLRYQWQNSRDGVLPTEKTAVIMVNPIARADDGLQLSVTVTDRLNQRVTSRVAIVTVRAAPPVIVSHPLDLQATAGTTAVLSAASVSSAPQDLQWERFDPVAQRWGAAGSQTAQLSLQNVQTVTDDQALFRFTARNAGTAVVVNSLPARLTVRAAESAPAIVTEPLDFATVAGRSASFTVIATGGGLTYEWQRRDAFGAWPVVGTNSAVLTLANTAVADDGAVFRVRIHNSVNEVFSRQATLSVPSTAGVNTIRVGGGAGHSVGLRGDGSLFAWGDNRNGELGRGLFFADDGAPEVVAGLTGVASFAVGYQHTFAILSDGNLHAWGQAEYGKLGTGRSFNEPHAVPIGGFNAPVRFVAAGLYSSIAIAAHGTYWSWGGAYHGDHLADIRLAPSQVGHPFVRIAIGGDGRDRFGHNLGLRSDGTVWAWGINFDGELGTGDRRAGLEPRPVTGVSQVIAVAAGRLHSIALTADGTVYAWGRNTAGQIGTGTVSTRELVPMRVVLPGIVVGIAAGQDHSMALLSDGRVFVWGENAQGQLGNGSPLLSATPISVAGGWTGPIKSIGAGRAHSLALDAAGNVWGWGSNDRKQLGNIGAPAADRPIQVPGVNLN